MAGVVHAFLWAGCERPRDAAHTRPSRHRGVGSGPRDGLAGAVLDESSLGQRGVFPVVPGRVGGGRRGRLSWRCLLGPGVTLPKSRPSGMQGRSRWPRSRSRLSSRARLSGGAAGVGDQVPVDGVADLALERPDRFLVRLAFGDLAADPARAAAWRRPAGASPESAWRAVRSAELLALVVGGPLGQPRCGPGSLVALEGWITDRLSELSTARRSNAPRVRKKTRGWLPVRWDGWS